jgi:hypothetical protein
MANNEFQVEDIVRSEQGQYGVVISIDSRKGATGLDGEYTHLIVQYPDGSEQRCNPELTIKADYSMALDSEAKRVLREIGENLPEIGTIGRAELVDRLMGLRELVLGKESSEKGIRVRKVTEKT